MTRGSKFFLMTRESLWYQTFKVLVKDIDWNKILFHWYNLRFCDLLKQKDVKMFFIYSMLIGPSMTYLVNIKYFLK